MFSGLWAAREPPARPRGGGREQADRFGSPGISPPVWRGTRYVSGRAAVMSPRADSGSRSTAGSPNASAVRVTAHPRRPEQHQCHRPASRAMTATEVCGSMVTGAFVMTSLTCRVTEPSLRVVGGAFTAVRPPSTRSRSVPTPTPGARPDGAQDAWLSERGRTMKSGIVEPATPTIRNAMPIAHSP